MSKTCTSCGEDKPLDEFGLMVIRNRRKNAVAPEIPAGTRHDVCKACAVAEATARRIDSGGSLKALAAKKRYAEKHKTRSPK